MKSSKFQTHKLNVKGKSNKVYRVTIVENTKYIMTDCSCGATQKCLHVLFSLAGIFPKISSECLIEFEKLQFRLQSNDYGLLQIQKAKNFLSKNRYCILCGVKIHIFTMNLKQILNQYFKRVFQDLKCIECRDKI